MPSLRAEKKAFRASNARAIDAAVEEPLHDVDEMPFSAVVHQGVEYRIHGVAHGQRRHSRLSPRMKTWMRAQIEAMCHPPEEDFVTERRFARLLALDEEHELDYMRALLDRLSVKKVLVLFVIALSSPLWIWMLPVALRLSRDPLSRSLRGALRDERCLPRLRKVYELSELPPARRVELAPKNFHWLHSEVMAEAAVAYAENHGSKVLHIVCGLAHESDLVYLLGR
jgi:hypothetical protein